MAAVPAVIYLAVQAGVVGVLWGFSVLHHHPLDLHPWDGDWYLEIAKHGYLGVDRQMADAYGHRTQFTPMAFFPGYPIIFAVVAKGLGGDYVAGGVVVSVVAGAAAVTGVARLVGMVTRSQRTALTVVVLFAAAPMSVVYALVYPEALLAAASVWALVCVVQCRWWFAGPLAALAGWVSPMGVPVVARRVVGGGGGHLAIRGTLVCGGLGDARVGGTGGLPAVGQGYHRPGAGLLPGAARRMGLQSRLRLRHRQMVVAHPHR